jgi:hypothetical protein
MLTRADFEAVARAINWRSNSKEEAERTCEIIKSGLADSSRLTVNGNRAFDYDRFLAAATERWNRA